MGGADLLSLNALLSVRVAEHEIEHASRVEDIDGDTVVVAAPPGAAAVLLETGTREVVMTWVSPRGRYQQTAVLVEALGDHLRQWRLRLCGEPQLEQRRRYVRVDAVLPAVVTIDGETEVSGATVDIGEGGFRCRVPRLEAEPGTPTTVDVTIDGEELHLEGQLLRISDTPTGTHSDIVVVFLGLGRDADVIRRYIFQCQLRARAASRS